MLAPEYRARVQAVAAGTAPMDSILQCYYDARQELKLSGQVLG
ncbi:hypothetical protein [Hymenobacter sp. B1770]